MGKRIAHKLYHINYKIEKIEIVNNWMSMQSEMGNVKRHIFWETFVSSQAKERKKTKYLKCWKIIFGQNLFDHIALTVDEWVIAYLWVHILKNRIWSGLSHSKWIDRIISSWNASLTIMWTNVFYYDCLWGVDLSNNIIDRKW